MAIPTQTVVGKSIPNSLIVKGLLKILRNLVPLSPQNTLPIPFHRMVDHKNTCSYFSGEMSTDLSR